VSVELRTQRANTIIIAASNKERLLKNVFGGGEPFVSAYFKESPTSA
jgi:hypothetical protein